MAVAVSDRATAWPPLTCGGVTAGDAPSSSSRARARRPAALRSWDVRAFIVSPLGLAFRRARDLARRNHLRHLQLPPDARHRAHHGHRGDDDQTGKPWAAPSGDPGAPWPPPAANPRRLPSVIFPTR